MGRSQQLEGGECVGGPAGALLGKNKNKVSLSGLRGRGSAYEGSQCCLGLIWMQPWGVPGKIHKVWRHAPSLDISPSCLCKCGLERCREMRHDKEASLALELAPLKCLF